MIWITGTSGLVAKNIINKLNELNLKYISTSKTTLDLTNFIDTDYFLKCNNVDIVINIAAKVGGVLDNTIDPYNYLLTNLKIQNNVIEGCIKYNIKKCIFLGSSCIYPKDYKQPLKEEYLLKDKLEPTNEGYALAKICGLKLCEYANKQFNKTKFICLMPCNLYGPFDHFNDTKSHVLSALISKIYDAKINNKSIVTILGNGKPKREFLYIDDLIDCILWSLNINITDNFLNVGTGKDISIINLAKKIAKIINYNGKFIFDTSKPNGMFKKCLDVSKINNLGWKANIDIDNGLLKTINWYKEYYESNKINI